MRFLLGRRQTFADVLLGSDERAASKANTPAHPAVHGKPEARHLAALAYETMGFDARDMIVNGTPGVLRPAARISDPTTGIVMEVFTTQPGMQLYSDNVTRTTPGNGVKPYGNRYSMSFETQHDPDSPNRPEFPSTVVTPSTPLHEVTVYKFSTGK